MATTTVATVMERTETEQTETMAMWAMGLTETAVTEPVTTQEVATVAMAVTAAPAMIRHLDLASLPQLSRYLRRLVSRHGNADSTAFHYIEWIFS